MGWLSLLWSSEAKRGVRYLEERIIALENRLVSLENEVRSLKSK
jgi:hypothetical protein